jgi:putative ABC transport system substrate-binding protein
MPGMRRREFVILFGAAAAGWPLAARAQQDGRVRLIGLMDSYDDNNVLSQAIRNALRVELVKLNWVEGRNLRIERRLGVGDANRLRAVAAELVSLAPDVLVTTGAAPTRALQQATRTIPIVFTGGGDAAANGLVKNIARPEGNTTGFSSSEPTAGGKWLELLKEAAPRITRVAIVFNPEVAPTAPNYIVTIEQAARTLSVQTLKVPFRDAVELVRAIDAFAGEPNGGLLMLPPPAIADRISIIKLAAQHRLPAIYPQRALAAEGGLISYGADPVDQNRRAASYVDRVLRGTKVADLPVQFPTKYQLVVNMKTANAMDLTIPEAFLLHADELIE